MGASSGSEMVPLRGAITLFWILGFSVDVVRATECTTLLSGSDLTVPDNTECTVSADFGVTTLTLQGTMKVISPVPVTISAQTMDIQAGAKLSADAIIDDGPGNGNSLGSGGWESYSILYHNV